MRKALPTACLVGLLLVAGLVTGAGADDSGRVSGRATEVHPGGLQRAIDRAQDGDTLVIHQGRYRGAFVIEKRLRLVGAPGEPRPVIDGGCATNLTIAVRHSGVLLRHLEVVGADKGFGQFPSEVDFHGLASGRALDLVVRDTCDAEYGINVFDSREVDVIGNRGRGFSDSVIYIGGISSTGNGLLRVSRNVAFASNRGIIVEDSAGGRIRLIGNRIRDNTLSGEGQPAGVFLHNSDGVLLSDNLATDNGSYGFELDPNSDRNRLLGNTARRNPAGNFHDEGTGNCGSGNHPNPFPPCR